MRALRVGPDPECLSGLSQRLTMLERFSWDGGAALRVHAAESECTLRTRAMASSRADAPQQINYQYPRLPQRRLLKRQALFRSSAYS